MTITLLKICTIWFALGLLCLKTTALGRRKAGQRVVSTNDHLFQDHSRNHVPDLESVPTCRSVFRPVERRLAFPHAGGDDLIPVARLGSRILGKRDWLDDSWLAVIQAEGVLERVSCMIVAVTLSVS